MIRRSLLAVLLALAFFASPAIAAPAGSSSGGQKTVHVKTYTKKDGTVVEAHDRNAPTPKADVAAATPKDTTAKPAASATASTTTSAPARDSHGKILRSEAAKHAFEVSSGFPHGRTGYVVDHIVPLACGGPDDTSNMQWQTIADGKAKDKWERNGCK